MLLKSFHLFKQPIGLKFGASPHHPLKKHAFLLVWFKCILNVFVYDCNRYNHQTNKFPLITVLNKLFFAPNQITIRFGGKRDGRSHCFQYSLKHVFLTCINCVTINCPLNEVQNYLYSSNNCRRLLYKLNVVFDLT